MKTIKQSIVIHVSKEKIWSAIISLKKYRLWADAFHEGSYFEGDWRQGSVIKFLSKEADGHTYGLSANVIKNIPFQDISLEYAGLAYDNEVDSTSEEAQPWIGLIEKYHLESIEADKTQFQIETDIPDEMYEEFSDLWINGLKKFKRVCEENQGAFTPITVEATLDAPIETVWSYWTEPEKVQTWNFADPSWYCPTAKNDLTIGGTFTYTMSARDGSFSFDFSGSYSEITYLNSISNLLDDGRSMKVVFQSLSPDKTHLIETFDAEEENSLELQKNGWQSILDNFKKAVEKKL